MKNFAVIKPEVEKLITPALETLGLEVYEINETHDYEGDVLQILVDTLPTNSKQLDFDLLVKANETISNLLDTLPGLQDNYLLEVASVGLEKPIRSESELKRAVGSYVQITFNKLQKKMTTNILEGTLKESPEANGTFSLHFFIKGRPQTVVFEWKDVAHAQYAVKF
ncbi:ribosome maturation factor RimP [Entomoplasma freundtii]|uniref:Ribosome maturation factor RimP n=1 Tax=Entomoplasma freundtii TaxID=74700 RepID=A0A2K8NRJ3_9MOLU|nr:ribosome assembly cofactor RimP [Entomoplasma freundtii]ATZ16482.1 ribosome maturation factor RimP [Entomoplasma freundtii]TDY56011.1 ribosome maturation factor RimP [Entomoplasma freundtii]